MSVNVKTNSNSKTLAETDQLPTDSGWIYPSISSNFTYYGSNSKPRYRKVNNIVYIEGAIKPTKTTSEGTTGYNIFTLNSGYRPTIMDLQFICQGSSTGLWLCTVKTTGSVEFSRYRGGTSWWGAATTEWLPFAVSFIAA